MLFLTVSRVNNRVFAKVTLEGEVVNVWRNTMVKGYDAA